MSGSTGPIPGSSQPTQEASQSNAAAKRARKAARKAALLSTPSQQPAATPLPALQPVPTSAKKERKAEKKRQRALSNASAAQAPPTPAAVQPAVPDVHKSSKKRKLEQQASAPPAVVDKLDGAQPEKKKKRRNRHEPKVDVAPIPAQPVVASQPTASSPVKSQPTVALTDEQREQQRREKKERKRARKAAAAAAAAEVAANAIEPDETPRKKRKKDKISDAAPVLDATPTVAVKSQPVVEPSTRAQETVDTPKANDNQRRAAKSAKREKNRLAAAAALSAEGPPRAEPSTPVATASKPTAPLIQAPVPAPVRVPAPAPVSARPRVPAAPAFAPVASGSKSAPVPDLDDEDMLNSFLNSSLASQSSLATRGVKKAASKTVDTGKGKGKGKAKAVSPEASEDDDEEENSRGSKTRKTRASNRTTKATPRTTKTKPATAKSLPGSSDTLASVISSRWLTGPQIKDLEAQYNTTYSKGKFTSTETEALENALEEFRDTHKLTEDEMTKLIFSARQGDDKQPLPSTDTDFWITLSMKMGTRPVLAVYNHVRRMHDPRSRAGPWSEAADQQLRAAVTELGSKWTKVGERVGRLPGDCKDRWTKQLAPSTAQKKGKWTTEEEDRLRTAYKKAPGAWKTIEKLMGDRSAAQCRTKWRDDVSRRDTAAEGSTIRFHPEDRSVLVHAVADLKANDTTEINWGELDVPTIKHHGSKNLHDRWRSLVRKARDALLEESGNGDPTHAEEVAYLLNKYPVLGERGLPARRKSRAKDPTQPRKAANKGIQSSKSKEMIDSSDEDEDEDFEIQRELVLGRSSGRTNYADGSSSEDEDEDEDDE